MPYPTFRSQPYPGCRLPRARTSASGSSYSADNWLLADGDDRDGGGGVDSLADKFKPESYTDAYRTALEELIEQKMRGEKPSTLTVCFADSAVPPCMTFRLVVHPAIGERRVEIFRHSRPVESVQAELQKSYEENARLRAEIARLRATIGKLERHGARLDLQLKGHLIHRLLPEADPALERRVEVGPRLRRVDAERLELGQDRFIDEVVRFGPLGNLSPLRQTGSEDGHLPLVTRHDRDVARAGSREASMTRRPARAST